MPADDLRLGSRRGETRIVPYHVGIRWRKADGERCELYALNLGDAELSNRVVRPYASGNRIAWGGRTVPVGDVEQITITQSTAPKPPDNATAEGILSEADDVTNEWITSGPSAVPAGIAKDRLSTIVSVAGGVAGLAAYLYVVGGVVSWLRLIAARLPADTGITSADNHRLLAQGIRVLLFEAILVAVLAVITGFVVWLGSRETLRNVISRAASAVRTFVRARTSRSSSTPGADEGSTPEVEPSTPRAPEWQKVLSTVLGAFVGAAMTGLAVDFARGGTILILLAIVIGVVLVTVLFVRVPRARPYVRWIALIATAVLAIVFASAPIGIAILSAVVVIALVMLRKQLPVAPASNRAVDLLRAPAVLISALLLTGVAMAYVATPPVGFDRVTMSGSPGVAAYIDRTNGGILVATCTAHGKTSSGHRLRVVTDKDARNVRFGGERYRFDSGGRPSLFDLFLSAVGDPNEIEDRARLRADFRRTSALCGKEKKKKKKKKTTTKEQAPTQLSFTLVYPASVTLDPQMSFIYPVGKFDKLATGTVAFLAATGHRQRHTVRVATKPFIARAGGKAAVRVRLSTFVRRQVKRHHRVDMRATITIRSEAGTLATRTHSFVLRTPSRA
jgi:hypothetical protein